MGITQDFRPLELDDLVSTARSFKEDGYRLAQIHPLLERDDSISMFYTFVKCAEVINFCVKGIEKGVTEVPSVTDLFIAAFVFENEAHDLYGVNVVGNVLDFKGKFYQFAEGVEAPMTIISPEQLAAREKAAKVAAAKAARAAKAKAAAEEKADAGSDVPSTSEGAKAVDDLEQKLAGMDPEKAAKVRAAMEAKAKREKEKKQQANDGEGE